MNIHKTLTGDKLRHLIAGRQLYIWGASIVGSGICRALERTNFPPDGFIDSSPRLNGKTSLGYPVLSPAEILDNSEHRADAFIIIASGHYEAEISERCQRGGLQKGQDFISARDLSPLDPSVDVAGLCNLKCISCPRGNYKEQPPSGFMTAETYRSVLKKLLTELPFMGNIQLYAWGEPLLNPEIAKIIRMTVSEGVLCAISTNLNVSKNLEEVIKARPDWIKVSASGYGNAYELTHTGGHWETLHTNLRDLSRLKHQHHPEMYVEINYHLYKNNRGEAYQKMSHLCQELGFIFRPNWAYLYPLDKVKDFCEGRQIGKEAHKTLELLQLPIEEGLQRARQQAHLVCAEERCFPIAWDLSVRSCGAYFWPTICDNFLAEPLKIILEKREKSGICSSCRQHALHRFTSVYVEEALPSTRPDGIELS